jgi:hypothetical protein
MDHQTINRLEAAETDHQDGPVGTAGSRPESEAGTVRARLNGLPCLVSVSTTATISGRMAVPPFAGERRPFPIKGRRATLDLIDPADGAGAGEEHEDAPLACIEIMVVEASRRSGRFAGRVLGLTDEEARALAMLAHG